MAGFRVLTDVIDGSGTEFPMKFLGAETSQVCDGERPQVQDVVPGEGVPLLHHHHLGPEEAEFYGSAQPAGSGTDY